MKWYVFFLCLLSPFGFMAHGELSEKDVKRLVRAEVKRLLPTLINQNTRALYESCLTQASKNTERMIQSILNKQLQKTAQTDIPPPPIPLPMIGDPNASKIILIFTDPYCHFCHQSLDLYDVYIQKHPEFKMVIYDFPLGGRDSYTAVCALLTAHKHKKHAHLRAALHRHVQKENKTLSKPEIIALAKKQGIPTHDFEKKMNGNDTRDTIRHTLKVAKHYNIKATPSFIYISGPQKKPRIEEGMISPQELLEEIS